MKYLLIEHGYSQAMRFNSYLATGDERILKEDVESLKGTLSYTKQFFNYWKEVYKLNQSLSDKNKIVVIGIDLGWTSTAIKYLNTQLSEVSLDSLPLLKKLLTNQNDSLSQDELVEGYEAILAELKNPEDIQLNEEKLFEVQYIIKNLIHSIDAFSEKENHDIHRKRDQYMYENFIELYERLPKGKFYGQWGLNHIYQSPQLTINWLAYLLDSKEESPVKGKILSIATFYNNSERIKWRSEETQILDSFLPNLDTLTVPLISNNVYLFRLNAPHSQFKNKLLWYTSSKPETGVTTDYFDYMIVGNELKASDRYFTPSESHSQRTLSKQRKCNSYRVPYR